MSHITVCVCSYKRPLLLSRLLNKLACQRTDGHFSYSIVVVDNDKLMSAKGVVEQFARESQIPIRYFLEEEQNIALARNKAVANSVGDYVAFIDDDEFPIESWLFNLFTVCNEHGVDGVLGPVRRHFDEEPPDWIRSGSFYERPILPTGLRVEWSEARTGNVLLRRELFVDDPHPFRPDFRSGEDQDFFRRSIEKGRVFVWSSEAVVFESVPPIRWKRTFMLRRALLRGAMNRLHPTFGFCSVAKSMLAVAAYAMTLPFALLMGQHRFMTLLVKLCDHLGKLLAFVGVHVVREPYVTD